VFDRVSLLLLLLLWISAEGLIRMMIVLLSSSCGDVLSWIEFFGQFYKRVVTTMMIVPSCS